ncbi:Methionine aminopeptidase 2-2 [Pyrenophora tritici-repentis]|uniref:Methionine aminopeptidase 2-1 n=3 Tax=Pyrenophora tritici-repentis TaxID=45151 RepID=MAP21_PYRTR|nr:methionine aminopeptidase 2 [Pyrenophora tritici-repentis Pt-1C-BFP]B2VW14.1 RecName: Full=Methionine aminopeptidase 2-1; Short=MAP 2-1; Short=MetAP 2-1; AltName: Full=Peptidase M [Pyrenophora tritici-repentis Pt-1C-BFP]KAI1513497.1 Methionine aminopeptidase 2-2 [Pyrenophora tritici-repentis]EDU40814.1 methionine aminopeptidase 2 [Pyrenophora tritici-repentis Pt-1C-BFP]KAI1674378.1 Methionine aminopeptidase 2-2 [Pyrenophora tritici-repentis]KAI1688506.1 Methionine aminopeptidase 2-2 [Pyreno
MGSKSPEDHRQGPDGGSADAAVTIINPPKSAAASGLLQGMLEGQDEDGDDDDDEKTGINVKTYDGAKKKRKRNKKKSKKVAVIQQTFPPRIPLATLFDNQPYPEGQIVDHVVKDDNIKRTTTEELRHVAALNDMDDDFLKDYRKAAEVHRQVRHHAQTIAKPGVSMTRLAEEIDEGVRALTGHTGLETGDALKAGLAFPTGLCLNHVGAHWTPNAGAKEVILKHDDVLKVDFGVHVNGRIVDSAFTVAANPVYDNLLAAVKAATNTGLGEAGIDARIDHISEAIQEVMESYEVELNGKTIPVKAVRNITGHNILRYRIHGDKQVPFVKTKTDQRMEEGDIFAIETFGSTGKAHLRDDVGVYGYGRNENMSPAVLHQSSAKSLLKTIDANFGTLVFARRQLERLPGVEKYHLGMRTLVNSGLVESYAPLVDITGSYIAQFEHTVLLRPNCKEIISRGDDY